MFGIYKDASGRKDGEIPVAARQNLIALKR
jgi:hypothetical protein